MPYRETSPQTPPQIPSPTPNYQTAEQSPKGGSLMHSTQPTPAILPCMGTGGLLKGRACLHGTDGGPNSGSRGQGGKTSHTQLHQLLLIQRLRPHHPATPTPGRSSLPFHRAEEASLIGRPPPKSTAQTHTSLFMSIRTEKGTRCEINQKHFVTDNLLSHRLEEQRV